MDALVHDQIRDLDALVVGAGFGGIYMLHKLRNELGLDAVAIDKAGGVGGTWYWNKYPGALSDSESFVYQYSFDRELYDQNPLRPSSSPGPRSSPTSTGVVDRYDLREHIHLETGMTEAKWDENSGTWIVRTDRESPTGPASWSPAWAFCRRRTPPTSTASNTSRAESSIAAPGPRNWT